MSVNTSICFCRCINIGGTPPLRGVNGFDKLIPIYIIPLYIDASRRVHDAYVPLTNEFSRKRYMYGMYI